MITAAIHWDPLDPQASNDPQHLAGEQDVWLARDLFHADVPTERVVDAYARMLAAHRHTFLACSEDAERMCELTNDPGFVTAVRQALRARTGSDAHLLSDAWWAEQNVWLGVRAHDQQQLEDRVPRLISGRTRARFVDCRPLQGPLDLYAALFGPDYPWQGEHPEIPGMNTLAFLDGLGYGIDLLIAGEAKDLGWIRSLRDQCVEGGADFNYALGELDGRTWTERPKILT